MNRIGILLKSKTVWGTVLGAATYLLGLGHSPSILEVVQAAGPVIAAVGVRDAISKNGAGQ